MVHFFIIIVKFGKESVYYNASDFICANIKIIYNTTTNEAIQQKCSLKFWYKVDIETIMKNISKN